MTTVLGIGDGGWVSSFVADWLSIVFEKKLKSSVEQVEQR